MKCPICGGFVIRQENRCKRIGNKTYVVAMIGVCKNGHVFTRKVRKRRDE